MGVVGGGGLGPLLVLVEGEFEGVCDEGEGRVRFCCVWGVEEGQG